MVAVVPALPLKGGLLLPHKIVDQNRMEASVFFLLLLCGGVFMLSFSALHGEKERVPCRDSRAAAAERSVYVCAEFQITSDILVQLSSELL